MKQGMLSIVLLATLVFAVFTGPDLWAAPGQDPYRQTVPTETPPTSPVVTETPTPTEEPPTETPTFTPIPTLIPTSTPTTIPTTAATSIPVPTTVPGSIICYHTVRPGETLFCIGRAYGVDPYAIAIKNRIVNPNLIYPGQVLAIPYAPRLLPPGPVCAPQCGGPTPVPPSCRWHHTVVWGENLYRISLRYGVSMWAIAEVNHIYNLHYIRAGQVLCIP
ncbi:MAG: LysM peptidoglycan-binding domain-containing protein [Anaerolineae bacterium]|nr:LysM peptidoglycan-binding domain-containing protein [Anaerolineae bacterium]